MEANTGTVRTVVVLGPVRTETMADYDLRARSMQAQVTVIGPDDRLVTDAVAIGKDTWFRITRTEGADAKQTCWMHADPAAIEETTGVDLPGGGGRGIPAGVIVALTASGRTQIDPDRVLGGVDIYSLSTAFSGKLPLMMGIDIDTTAIAPVVIDLDAGVVTGWRSSLVDLLGAVEDAGLELPSELQAYDDASMADASVDVELSELGTPVSVAPPPADQTVELSADQEQFAQDRQECEARQG